jgi:hypothetical protein
MTLADEEKHRLERAIAAAAIAALLLAAAAWATSPPAAARSKVQTRFLRAAEQGVAQAHDPKLWWERGRHWYRARLGQRRVASLWQVVQLFEAVNGIAVASPTKRHRRDVIRFANGAERYLNPSLEPVPGFGPRPGQDGTAQPAWFDDNGWWGLAFLHAYRATGLPRYLDDAELAQQFISVSGWDSSPGSPGGIWWNTAHPFYAGESLAGGTELSVKLYGLTGNLSYLQDALKFIAWGDQWLWNAEEGFYARLRTPAGEGIQRSAAPAAPMEAALLARYPEEAAKLGPASRRPEPPFDPLPMAYVQGPMILAQHQLCEFGIASFCDRWRQLAERSALRFAYPRMGPQFDAVFVRDMLELSTRDGDAAWYRLAKQNARQALRRARNRKGLYLRTWNGHAGGTVGERPGALQLHAATTSIFAWLAATPSP